MCNVYIRHCSVKCRVKCIYPRKIFFHLIYEKPAFAKRSLSLLHSRSKCLLMIPARPVACSSRLEKYIRVLHLEHFLRRPRGVLINTHCEYALLQEIHVARWKIAEEREASACYLPIRCHECHHLLANLLISQACLYLATRIVMLNMTLTLFLSNKPSNASANNLFLAQIKEFE